METHVGVCDPRPVGLSKVGDLYRRVRVLEERMIRMEADHPDVARQHFARHKVSPTASDRSWNEEMISV